MLIDAIGLKQPGVVACVGAGGKTSLMQSLVAAGLEWPIVVTTTTKMFYHQITPYSLVVTDNYGLGAAKVMQALAKQQQVVAWFSRQEGEKVIGIPFDWIDKLAAALPGACILVEADGARQCFIKAPSAQEPVIPVSTMKTIGLINISSLEQPLSAANTHRLELVTQIINKQPGEPITWLDIALLAVHQQGIFQYARGSRILLLSGSGDKAARQAAKQIAGYVKVADVGIDRVVVTSGYGVAMQPSEVYVFE